MCVCQSGGVYMFCNGVGCDGERVYWDGGSMIAVNGSIVSRGAQFSMNEVVSSINYQNYQLCQAINVKPPPPLHIQFPNYW